MFKRCFPPLIWFSFFAAASPVAMAEDNKPAKTAVCDVCDARDEAKRRYLATTTVIFESENRIVATALLVGCHEAITNFHVLKEDSATAEKEAKNELKEIDVVGASTPFDLVAFRSVNGEGLARIVFADKVEVGEIVVNWSNADGVDNFFRTYRIAKGEDKFKRILLDGPVINGESGSGLFNLKGELVGVISKNAMGDTGDRLYGSAISATVVKKFVEKMFPGSGSCAPPATNPEVQKQ